MPTNPNQYVIDAMRCAGQLSNMTQSIPLEDIAIALRLKYSSTRTVSVPPSCDSAQNNPCWSIKARTDMFCAG